MPPLYRMPIAYVTALVLLGAVALGNAVLPRDTPAISASKSVPASSIQPGPAAIAPKGVEPDASPDPILRTAEGLRRKVVVKDLGVTCRDLAIGGKPDGPPLDYFSIWYVHGEAAEAVQIGPRRGLPMGWVPRESVMEWDTRLMARPTPREGRPPLIIYREEACLLDALAGRTCPRHGRDCPTEGEEDEPASAEAARRVLGLPILATKAIPQPDGTNRAIFEVASLVKDVAPRPMGPNELPADLRLAIKHVYIAMAIDTTASMQDTINAVRRMATNLAADSTKRYGDVTLHLALVEYRDESPIYGFKTRTITQFTDPVRFATALDRISAAKRGDGSVDEAVFDGVDSALPTGEPLAEHLQWPGGREGEVATKVLILVGDAPDHARDLVRARKLADLARRSGITIAAVSIDREAGDLSRDEQARYRAQWNTLAEGSYRPLDKASGFRKPLPPVVLALNEVGQLVARLQGFLDDRIEHARDVAALARAEAEGKVQDYVNSQGLTLQQIAPVLKDLHRGEPAAKARPDPRIEGRKAASVRQGWIAERQNGKPFVALDILMTRAELDTLIVELTQFQRGAQGNGADLSDLIKIGTAAASGETAFLAADRGEQTFADHLRRREGLPPARPDSLLRRSQADLRQADDTYRAALVARLRVSIQQLVRRRNEPDWEDPKRTVEGMALVPYEPIDF